MKSPQLIVLLGIFLLWACQNKMELSVQDKSLVKSEIQQFMKEMDAAVSKVNEEAYANMFIRTDELAVASQGKLYPSYDAVRDTIHVHMSAMLKQSIQTIDEKIFVIDKEHAVITTSKATKATLKNGAEFQMPYALTILLVKINGEWKIAHYHN